MILTVALSAAPMLVDAAESAVRCREPMTVTLSQAEGINVDIRFACAPGERATIRSKRDGRCAFLTGDYIRGNSRVDRDGSRTFRLIDRDERANDLTYGNGLLVVRRGGKVVSSTGFRPARCR